MKYLTFQILISGYFSNESVLSVQFVYSLGMLLTDDRACSLALFFLLAVFVSCLLLFSFSSALLLLHQRELQVFAAA